MEKTADTGTVARVALLLRLIAEREGPFALGDIAADAGLPPPTVHRLLDLLAQQGLVAHEKTLRNYRVGAELYRIASLVRANVPLPRIVRPILADGAHEADETCYFALYLPTYPAVMYDTRVDSSHALDFRFDFNRPMSLLWGSSGRVILAHLPPERVDAAYAYEPHFSRDGRVPNRAELEEELRRIREQGYAHSRGQRVKGAVGVLAPVFDETNRIYGALGFSVPEPRFTEDRLPVLAAIAMRQAHKLSLALGYSERGVRRR